MVSSCIPAMAKYLEWCVTENRLLESESSGSEETEDDSQLNTTPLDQDLKERFIDLLKQTVDWKKPIANMSNFY